MRLLPVFLVSLSVSSLGLFNPQPSLSSNLLAQLGGLEDIENATTDILSGLGYDCQTAGALGIACTKCTTDDSITQTCKAYICDSITRSCREQQAQIPSVPDSVDDVTDGVEVDTDGVNVNPGGIDVDTDEINVNPGSVNVDTDGVDVNPGSVNVDTDGVDVNPGGVDVDTDAIPGL